MVIALSAVFVSVLVFFIWKEFNNLKKRNEDLLSSGQSVAYVKAESNVIIRKVGDEQITSELFEYIKKGGQEVICLPGDVEFLLSYHHTGGLQQVVKVVTKIQKIKASFKVEPGKTYVIEYSSDDGFFIEEREKISWTSGLYKEFKNKFPL